MFPYVQSNSYLEQPKNSNMEELMVLLGSQVQSIKQCISLRTTVGDERCWSALSQLDDALSQAEAKADDLDNYLTSEGL